MWWFLPGFSGGGGPPHRGRSSSLTVITDAAGNTRVFTSLLLGRAVTLSEFPAAIGKGFVTPPALGSLALSGAYPFGAGDPWVSIIFFFMSGAGHEDLRPEYTCRVQSEVRIYELLAPRGSSSSCAASSGACSSRFTG